MTCWLSYQAALRHKLGQYALFDVTAAWWRALSADLIFHVQFVLGFYLDWSVSLWNLCKLLHLELSFVPSMRMLRRNVLPSHVLQCIVVESRERENQFCLFGIVTCPTDPLPLRCHACPARCHDIFRAPSL